MGSAIKVNGDPLISLFFCVEAGSEEDVKAYLKTKQHKNLYKVLGQYDFLSLFNVTDFDNDKIYTSCDGIQLTRSISSFNIKINEQAPSTENIADWLANSPLLGFVFLEMDKWFYSQESTSHNPVDWISILIANIYNFGKEQGIDLLILGGYGRSEFYILVKSNRIEHIWKISRYCRTLCRANLFGKSQNKSPVFVNTRTIPCVSYNYIQQENNHTTVLEVEGKCSASILVNCSAGFEKYIFECFNKDLYDYKDVMGDVDGIAFTKKPIETKTFIEGLLNFRSMWNIKHQAEISTNTLIYDSENKDGLKPDRKINFVKKPPTTISLPNSLKAEKKSLVNRINNLTKNINSLSSNRSNEIYLKSIKNYISYIQSLANQYDKAGGDEKFVTEGSLMEATELAENGLEQRIRSNFDSLQTGTDLPLPFGDGIFSSLLATEKLIDHIFSVWQFNHPDHITDQHTTNGFPTYSDKLGYRMSIGEVFNLPLRALYDPCSKSSNWLTLSHEISHSIYLRLNVSKNHKKDIKRLSSLFSDGELSAEAIDDEVFELFAHWYDYYHFYNQDINTYLDIIWLSWIELPSVKMNIDEYLFRSVFIYFAHNIHKIRSVTKVNSETTTKELMFRLWDEHKFSLKNSRNKFPSKYLDELESKKIKILKLVSRLIAETIRIFELYKNDNFREDINKNYTLLDSQVKSINNGVIITSQIQRPYLLVKKIVTENIGTDSLKASTSLIMSLRNIRNEINR